MNHIELLKALKTILRPHTYLEVGIAAGDTLFSRPLPEFIIAIDPEPSFTANSFSMMTAIRSFLLFKTTSDEAFERLQNEQLLGNRKLDMSFVDGLHHAEVALRDIANCARFSRDNALICIHDVLPNTEEEASREINVGGAWMGDVYKLIPFFRTHMPFVSSIIIDDVPPSGMFIIRNSGEDLYGEIMRKYEVFLNEEKELSFHETISAIKQFSVSSKSEEFIRFVETVLSGHYNYEELSRHLIRALLE